MSRLLAIAIILTAAATARADGPLLRQKFPIPAQAGAVQVTCDYLEVNAATAKNPSLDSGLKPLEKKLKKGPFKQWNEFKLLSSGQRVLKKSKAEAITLKQGTASATLVEIVDKSKIRLKLEIDNAKGKQVANTTALFDAGDWVISTVQTGSGDGHLTALTCK